MPAVVKETPGRESLEGLFDEAGTCITSDERACARPFRGQCFSISPPASCGSGPDRQSSFEFNPQARIALAVGDDFIVTVYDVFDGCRPRVSFKNAPFIDVRRYELLNLDHVDADMGEDGMPEPHAHVMLTMRSVDENGFSQKVRDWNRTEMVERWRERWAELASERLAELEIDARIDHRSLEAQGIPLEPQSQIGAPAQRIEGEGIEAADRADLHREIARDNGARIIADPSVALDAITQQQSTFTLRDMAKFAHRHSDGMDQFNEVTGAMRGSPDLVELGKNGRGEDRFTTRDMIESEQCLHPRRS